MKPAVPGAKQNRIFLEKDLFGRRKPNPAALLAFGFTEKQDGYQYCAPVAGGKFDLSVFVSPDGTVTARVFDAHTGAEYVLHRVPQACGAFVGKVKQDYERCLRAVSEQCFEPDVFKSPQAREVIAYVRAKYGGELEYLWKQFPDNAVWRRKDTAKWYGALLVLSKRKLGLKSEEIIDVLDLRADPEEVQKLLDSKKYFPGYHMNKKHWYTLCLDGTLPLEEIFARIDQSYALAVR